MNILFLCKHNRFRSKIAEAYFNKINKNKKIKAKSRGLIRGIPVDKNVVRIGKEFGMKINRTPKGISEEDLKWQDVIIIVANNVPKSIFATKREVKKLIIWNIRDTSQDNKKEIRRIVIGIMKKVNNLNKQLENKKWK
jgi:protein-tyrosine-phosphatase